MAGRLLRASSKRGGLITDAAERANLSFSAASSAMQLLVDRAIAREITGKQRGRLFVYDRYIAVLNEGTEEETAV